MKTAFKAGQRWLSEAEPELGLGSVVASDDREVEMHFASRGLTRRYACDSAPLRRIRFETGDRVVDRGGVTVLIEDVDHSDDLLTYFGDGRVLPERDLGDSMDFRGPEERLAMGSIDTNELFDLRLKATSKRCELLSSPVRGLIGARISLLPHQLYIASEVSARHHIRVMLGDEVGLGKTIEAGLILHRLILSGLCGRVLIVVPESLQHQWFLELWRRFNLIFSLYDENRCCGEGRDRPDCNPFLESARVLCSIDFLDAHPERHEQILAAGWDMLVVDEAHHLIWTPDGCDERYRRIESLAQGISGVMLLSGTPDKRGDSGHFSRLRILDPLRFHLLKKFESEQSEYIEVADVVEELLGEGVVSAQRIRTLCDTYGCSMDLVDIDLDAVCHGHRDERNRLVAYLVDHHGTGRMFYRNQRRDVPGFPSRQPIFHEVGLGDAAALPQIAPDAVDRFPTPEFTVAQEAWDEWWAHDPRVQVVIDLLTLNPHEKILVICAKVESVLALQNQLEMRAAVRLGVFHEKLSLIVRDRNAAYFAEPDGARVLLCSEIGSEGRNFQFCRRLVLFDLPFDPELLEQRIGRLDRIGQQRDVMIHVPYIRNSGQEILKFWFHDGMNAFQTPVGRADEVLREFRHRILALAADDPCARDESALDLLARDTADSCRRIRRDLERGRDRLLAWQSNRPGVGKKLVNRIEQVDTSSELPTFLESCCRHLNVTVSEHDYDDTWTLGGEGDGHRLPGLSEAGDLVTFSRRRALAREDLVFLSWEHPSVVGAVDLLLGSWSGRAGYAVWQDDASRAILLETVFLVQCVAPAILRPDRFLPPTPVRIMIDHLGSDLTDSLPHETLVRHLKDDSKALLLRKQEVTKQLLPDMISKSREYACVRKQRIVADAVARLHSSLDREIDRLQVLAATGAPVRSEATGQLQDERRQLQCSFEASVLQLDAIRLVWRGPAT